MQTVPLTFRGGLDRSRAPAFSDLGTLFNLKGFRQRPAAPGELEQTPYYYQLQQRAQGTYWNAGSITETTTSYVVARVNNPLSLGAYITISDYVAWDDTSVQTQCFCQTTVPAANTINTNCFLVINNLAGLAITLGSTLDIVIDGATTFKWRKNGGAYTTLVPITTTGVSIDSGNATVYFLIATGFTIADTWSWTRTDTVQGVIGTASLGSPLILEQYKGEYFYIAATSRVMKITKTTSSELYFISAGYRPIYGLGLTVYYDHLVVICSATTTALTQSSNVVSWSDNVDINNFFATDVNEADSYTVPRLLSSVVVNLGAPSYLRSCFVWNNVLYLLTADRVYYTSYLGLPDVFSFAPFRDFITGTYITGPIYTGDVCVATGSSRGVYIASNTDIYCFDGMNFRLVSAQLRGLAGYGSYLNFNGGYPQSLHYVPATKELYVRDAFDVLNIYQEELETWYTRYAGFSGAGGSSVSMVDRTGSLGTKSRKVLTQDVFPGISTLVYDDAAGTAFGTPTITTQVLSGGLFERVKEISGLYLTAYIPTSGIGSTFYSTGTNCVLAVKWYVANDGQISGTPTSVATNTLTSASVDGSLSFPRTSFRGLALQVELTGLTSGKPPYCVRVLQMDLRITHWPQPAATR